ncbi:MAG: tRNA (adenosine(37)-N6)-threonylcarbamoyltransferase complex ATPase subunit type 1 TsaE [Dehalococcoidales bacterium]|nr:tRNA (adenosine(37)-N6)-threonylcarbamoyltransferase complex ATPase subunit type 1 TsaE [Dehalococcoidales bacterium]
MTELIVHSKSPAATLSLGKRLGKLLAAGSILALVGELGCGKTLFTKGVCTGLEVPARYVNSPTFAFVNEYRGRLKICHMDVYRLNDIGEGFGIGMLDYLVKAESGVMIVEWAEKIYSLLPEDCLRIDFAMLSPRERRISFKTCGTKYDGVFKELAGK